ncbi:MAG: hypothetical protein R3D03_07725 [Geminicoccaceae bacterium]
MPVGKIWLCRDSDRHATAVAADPPGRARPAVGMGFEKGQRQTGDMAVTLPADDQLVAFDLR